MKEYYYIIVPFVALMTTQLIKFIIESIQHKTLRWGRLLNGSGGMPSSHSAFCFSITIAILLKEGVTSPLFASCLVFSMIVCYDAMGLRKESGNQAIVLNQIIEEMFHNKKQAFQKLKEELGHNPLEVLVGVLYGSFVASLFYLVLF